MPIRPENKSRYPKDWKLRSFFVRFVRARGQGRRNVSERTDGPEGVNPLTALSPRMKRAMVMLRLETTASPWSLGWNTYKALLKRGLVEEESKDANGWPMTRITAHGEALFDRIGAPQRLVRCSHCGGTGKVAAK